MRYDAKAIVHETKGLNNFLAYIRLAIAMSDKIKQEQKIKIADFDPLNL